MKGICIVGYVYWGLKLVRIFLAASAGAVVAVCEDSSDRLLRAKQEFPGVLTFCSFDDVLVASEIEAVALATPVSSHFQLARRALEAGKHVLVEKPITHSLASARELMALAELKQRVLTVDHTFVYHPAVNKIKALVAGDVFAPKIFGREALSALVGNFWDAIKTGKRPVSDGTFGADAVAILECAEKSVHLRGAEVAIL